eukprot:2852121-Pleurochrysis_carterae.AAC.2
MSTFSKSETGPSSSTFHLVARSTVKDVYSDCGPSSGYRMNTHGSASDCRKPHSLSHGNRERCQRRPACAIP